MSRLSGRIRLLVIVLVAVPVLAAVAILIFVNNLRNKPVELGDSEGEIVFISNRDGDWDVYALNFQESAARPLTGEGGMDFHASWELNGEGVSFLTDRESDDIDLALVDPQGENVQLLSAITAQLGLITQGRVDWDAKWSPDCSQIAWVSLRDFNAELYLADAMLADVTQTADLTRLTNEGAVDFHPAWSPDGTQVIFASERAGKYGIYSHDIASGEVTELTDAKFDDVNPAWSLDGSQILFTDEDMELFIMDADGGNRRPFSADMNFEGDAVWSPDGTQILYMSNAGGDWEIYIKDIDGDNVRQLTDNDADDMFAVWRP